MPLRTLLRNITGTSNYLYYFKNNVEIKYSCDFTATNEDSKVKAMSIKTIMKMSKFTAFFFLRKYLENF